MFYKVTSLDVFKLSFERVWGHLDTFAGDAPRRGLKCWLQGTLVCGRLGGTLVLAHHHLLFFTPKCEENYKTGCPRSCPLVLPFLGIQNVYVFLLYIKQKISPNPVP